MKFQSNLNSLLPAPGKIRTQPGRLDLHQLRSIYCEPELERFADALQRAFAFFGIALKQTRVSDAGIVITLDDRLPAEGWHLKIETGHLRLSGGTPAGIFYGIGAVRQLLTLAFSRGNNGDHNLECGIIDDAPRYSWRGFMLDSARHFQSVAKIKELIRHLADYRINVLHWHLTDDVGWRTPSCLVPKLNALGKFATGQYTPADIREITSYAAEHFIRIIPEIDIPGHSWGLLQAYPHLACNPDKPGREYCLGSASTRKFVIELLGEIAGLFPESDVIHIGGDEADTNNWEQCPCCRAAMHDAGLGSFRDLESGFMKEMSQAIIALGRRPMVWATEAVMPPETIIQGWTSVFDISKALERGNHMVFSIHNQLYFDYPEKTAEPRADWMPLLPEESVYATNPRVHLGTRVDAKMLGVEACLWTETVPEWRLLQKTLPRLQALGELAWSLPENRNWQDFLRRKMLLQASGYELVCEATRQNSEL